MPDKVKASREAVAGLFLEISILEHLGRTRIEGKYGDGLDLGQFGILGYLIRLSDTRHTIGSIAWTFQEDEARVERQVRGLAELGLVTLTEGIKPLDSVPVINAQGREAYEARLSRMEPEFRQIVSEIPPEDLETAYRVLHELRLVMDNLPDR